MNDHQHDVVVFILSAIFLGALAAGITLFSTDCGGTQFTALDEKRDDAGIPEDAPNEAAALATLDAAAPITDADAAAPIDVSVNIPDAAPVEDHATSAEAAACELSSCKPCMFGNTPCCTTAGNCGCSDFGPVCLGN